MGHRKLVVGRFVVATTTTVWCWMLGMVPGFGFVVPPQQPPHRRRESMDIRGGRWSPNDANGYLSVPSGLQGTWEGGDWLSPDEFDRCQQMDSTIRALSILIPMSLTKPLTTLSTQRVFEENVQLTVLVDSEEIPLLRTCDELIALSDVLVLSTAAAQQANSLLLFGGGSPTGGGTSTRLECQIVIDPYGQSLMIPWRATVPIFPGTVVPAGNGRRMNLVEGLSEFQLNNATGKVEKHILRKAFWNGQSLQGPAIGQALRALQSTMTTLQKSPIFRGSNALLEQVATAASSSLYAAAEEEEEEAKPSTTRTVVLVVDSIETITGWITNSSTYHSDPSLSIPLPGTKEWNDYAAAHTNLVELREVVIPTLSSLQEDISKYFDQNATLLDIKGKVILQGQESLSNYFQSLVLARKGTGGSWMMETFTVLDWRQRQASVQYIATNTPLTIAGRDVYTLSKTSNEFPLIQEIRQTELTVATTDGSMTLDGTWLMTNLASAVERSNKDPMTIAPVIRTLFTDLLFQPTTTTKRMTTSFQKSPRTVTQTAAANAYYIMTELHERLPNVLNSSSSSSNSATPPVADYLSDNVELKGYLGETLLRGSTTYNRAVGSLLAVTRQALDQKRLLLLDSSRPLIIELTPLGRIRVSWTLPFRVPAGPLPAPLLVELVSDYVLDPHTGLVIQHRLIETRVNGQLTPGDVLSRRLAGFFQWEQGMGVPQEEGAGGSPRRRNSDDLLQTITDAVSWLRSISSS